VKTNEIVPAKFELAQNDLSPFSSVTAIPYALETHSDARLTGYEAFEREA